MRSHIRKGFRYPHTLHLISIQNTHVTVKNHAKHREKYQNDVMDREPSNSTSFYDEKYVNQSNSKREYLVKNMKALATRRVVVARNDCADTHHASLYLKPHHEQDDGWDHKNNIRHDNHLFKVRA
jgi:hypothetical protein